MSKPRGVLPTLSGDSHLALCKVGPRVRNTYEVRLCLYFAVTRGREFLLVVSPTAKVDAGLKAHLAAHGGRVIREAASDHSIYVGAEDPVGGEIDGWVACAGSVWSEVLGQATSGWLRDNLVVGRECEGEDLRRLRAECLRSPLKGMNIDEEPLAEAMINLIDAAESAAGCVFVQ